MNDDEIKRILEGFRPLEEIVPASALDGLVGAPAIILDSSPFCRGFTGGFDESRLPAAQISREGKAYSIPASYEVRELEEARVQGQSIFEQYMARHESMLAAMRERELEEQAAEAMAALQSLGDAPAIPRGRIFETTNDDGEKVVYVMPEPDPIKIKIPMSFALPPTRLVFGHRLGGFVERKPLDRIIVTSLPMPDVAGVDAMLRDGWVWTGWRFARDLEPAKEWTRVVIVSVEDFGEGSGDQVFVRTGPEGHPGIGKYRRDDAEGDAVLVPGLQWLGEFWRPGDEFVGKIGKRQTVAPGRYAGFIGEGRVRKGRYADRLPTNRKRKRERAKARRRWRKREGSR